ncbi:DNA cytosine methyltransferase [Pedobacter sp. MC2016-05]|uniref:DNA cytosine methyltransferase n=1 Tax=Pedobacter sp. MC2016-05 TaxID=2994474 RepID=UPI002246EDD8|nr:DNA cytosine methyltransferase [Pedobacter sp. MC2016-05]MCX2473547.1 DNA cytosine methyltransferase [Pedobacter sp. MC2016-05]
MGKYKPTAKSYFSGCLGMDIGFMQAGVDVVQSLDLDIDAINCIKLNDKMITHKVLHEDIKNITVLSQQQSDIIIGTYPCTKYSAIADIHGTRTGDDLFLHFFRHIAIEQPEMYVIENVPGMKKFEVVMEAMSKMPGYYINIFCPVDALEWLPQSRKRLILVGTRKRFAIAPPKSTKKIKLKSILELDPIYEMPQYVINRINGNYRDKPIVVDPNVINAYAPTCVAHYSKDLGTRLVKDKNAEYGARPFTIREYARLQGFPDEYIFPDKRSSYKLIGNAVPCHMARWIGTEAMKYFN